MKNTFLLLLVLSLSGCKSTFNPEFEGVVYEESGVFTRRDLKEIQSIFQFKPISIVSRMNQTHHLEGYEKKILLQPGDIVVATRKFQVEGALHYLIVHEPTMQSEVIKADQLLKKSDPLPVSSSRLLSLLTRSPPPLTKLIPSPDHHQLAVTIDMCQSRRNWDLEMFEKLVELGKLKSTPIKVGIAMTGLWAHKYPQQLQQLAKWQREGFLKIDWINHSFHHYVSKDHEGHYHFMTALNVDTTKEVLDLEKLLLSQRLVPSVLFRFPGLMHDFETRSAVNRLSLFSIDANNWLAKFHAKNRALHKDSVILIHGNGNEPVGIRAFLELVEKNWPSLVSGEIEFASPLTAIPLEE